MTSTFTEIERPNEGEMPGFSDSVKFDPNYKLNYAVYIMDLWHIILWETEKRWI